MYKQNRTNENMNRYKKAMGQIALAIGSLFGYVAIAAGIIMTILILSSVFTNAVS
jgi:hypothetical protein